MTFTTTLVFYALVGLGVSASIAVNRSNGNLAERLFQIVTAVTFWPMFIPLLLRTSVQVQESAEPHKPIEPSDDLAASIQQVESELDAAVESLNGWAENVLPHEQDRFAELKSTWRQQADRIRELDDLLAKLGVSRTSNSLRPESDVAGSDDQSSSVEARAASSEMARSQNIARLADVRRKLADDLMGTLAWVRELVTMIHLAKFTGAPASRAEELVSQIAAAAALESGN